MPEVELCSLLDYLDRQRSRVWTAPVAVALRRAGDRGAGADRFESERASFFERVRAAYLAILAREPHRVRRLDATAGIASVASQVAAELDALLARTPDDGTQS